MTDKKTATYKDLVRVYGELKEVYEAICEKYPVTLAIYPNFDTFIDAEPSPEQLMYAMQGKHN